MHTQMATFCISKIISKTFLWKYCMSLKIKDCAHNVNLNLKPIPEISFSNSWVNNYNKTLTRFVFFMNKMDTVCQRRSKSILLRRSKSILCDMMSANTHRTTESWKKNPTLGNSISNHPEQIDNVTHTTQIFFRLFPVVGIMKTRQSWKFEFVTPNGFQNIAFLRFHMSRKAAKSRH